MKIFNYLNGLFFIGFGLYGTCLPEAMGNFMGWELSLLGLHEMRAVFLFMAALGAMLCFYTKKLNDQKPLTLAIIFAMLSFLTGRLLGLILDGAGPVQTYQEMGIEIVVITLGVFLYKRGK